jgi:hypothetical protein
LPKISNTDIQAIAKKPQSGAMAAILYTKLPAQRKEDMPKTATIDHGVLQMALVGFELQRNRIDAAISEIEAELGQGSTRHSTATTTDSSAPKTPRKKRFSAAARKRMAAAQRKRWRLLKAKKAEAAKPKSKPAAKRKKASAPASLKVRHAQVKAAKKTVLKPKARKAVPKVRKAVAKPKVQEPAPQVQAVVEQAATEATA